MKPGDNNGEEMVGERKSSELIGHARCWDTLLILPITTGLNQSRSRPAAMSSSW